MLLLHCCFLVGKNWDYFWNGELVFIKLKLNSDSRGHSLFRVDLNKVYFQSSASAAYVKHDIISVGNVMVEVNPAVRFSGVKLMDHSSL